MPMRLRAALVMGWAVLLLGGWGPAVAARQDADEPAGGGTPSAPPAEREPFVIGVYVAVGGGLGSTDALDTSLLTDATHHSSNAFTIEEQRQAVFALGWRLPEGKGDFRLLFRGYEETAYEFRALGGSQELPDAQLNPTCDLAALVEDVAQGLISEQDLNRSPGYLVSPLGGACLYNWWGVSIKDGELRAVRTPATWVTPDDDLNTNNQADPGEIRYLASDRGVDPTGLPLVLGVPDDLQNQVVTWDAMYGREFGGRRYGSRWWGGLRYFAYEGQALAAAWLGPEGLAGAAYTDHAFLPLLNFAQNTTGWGPWASWEVDFNFFDKRLAFFFRGEAALTFNQLETDTGTFFSIVADPDVDRLAPLRIHEQRDKSAWQTGAELGTRIRLRSGLEFELGYGTFGYLDTVLLPASIALPQTPQQILDTPEETVSALFSTQDLRIDSWHGTVGFQF